VAIIDDNQAATPARGPAKNEAVDVQQIRASMKLPPEMQDAYQRVVVAGGKFLFDPKTHQVALDSFTKGKGPIGDRLGKGIAGLMVLLFKQSNNSIPPQVIVPAAIDLLAQAAQFLQESGVEEVSAKDVGDAMVALIQTLTTAFGGDAKKLDKLLAKDDPNEQDVQELADENAPKPTEAPGPASEETGDPEVAEEGAEDEQAAWDEESAARQGDRNA